MKSFVIKAKVWRYPGAGGWHFVEMDEKTSARVKKAYTDAKVGWHFLKIHAKVGKTEWDTTLFPTKYGKYLLAIKADVRKKEGIWDGDMVQVACTFR